METSISSQRGQGLVEYLLILVLTAAFVMALSRGVGRPIQRYIQSNVLDIVGCMLRVGQFPTQSFGLCQEAARVRAEFASSVPDLSNESSGASSATNSQRENNANNANNNRNNTQQRNNSGTTVRSPSRKGGSLDGGGSSGDDSSAPKSVKVNKGDLDGGGSFRTGQFKRQGDTIIVRKIGDDGRIGGAFYISEDSKKKSDDKPKFKLTSTKVNPVATDELRSANSTFAVPKSKDKRLASVGVDTNIDADLSFLGTVKWVIIIIILIIFGVFAASQINSIRKGWTD